MRFAIFKGEKSLDDLIKRLFHVQWPGSRAAAEEVEALLLQANPQLKDLQTCLLVLLLLCRTQLTRPTRWS